MAEVKVYTTSFCPYCVAAKNFLKERGIPFQEIDLSDKPEELRALKARTGWSTVPQIFVGDKLIGGFTDMRALDEDGKLDPLIKG